MRLALTDILPARFTPEELRKLHAVRSRHIAESFLRDRGQLEDLELPARLRFVKWLVITERVNDGVTPLPTALADHAILGR